MIYFVIEVKIIYYDKKLDYWNYLLQIFFKFKNISRKNINTPFRQGIFLNHNSLNFFLLKIYQIYIYINIFYKDVDLNNTESETDF